MRRLHDGQWIIFEHESSGNDDLTLSTHEGETDEGETDEERKMRVEAYRTVELELAAQAAKRG